MWNKITEPDNLEMIIEINLHCKKLKLLPDWISKCNNLTKLDCSSNKLIELPCKLPDSLQNLYCNNNCLTYLPIILPESLYLLLIFLKYF